VRPWDIRVLGSLGSLEGLMRNAESAQERLRQLQRLAEMGRPAHMAMALVHLGSERDNEALASLERAAELRESGVLYVRMDERFARLSRHQRFLAVVLKTGLQPQHHL
jgi:hypothetical protein